MKGIQRQQRQVAAIASLYEEPLAPRWPAVLLDACSMALDAHGAAMFDVGQHGTIDAAVCSTLSTREQERRYWDYYSERNPVMPLAAPVMRLGVIADRAQFISDRAYRRCEFYVDYVREQGYFHELGLTIENRFGRTLQLFVARAPRQRPFSDVERHQLAELGRHASALLRLRRQALDVSAARLELPVGGGTLAFLSLDAMNRIVQEAGPMLDRLFARGTLKRSGSVLRFQDLAVQRAFEGAVRACLRGGAGSPAMAISVDGERLSLEVFALQDALHASRARIAVVLSRRTWAGETDSSAPQLAGLTGAEARLAEALARGDTLKEHAAHTGRSLNTVRSHLKRVFSKLGVKRQHQLVAMLRNAGR